MKSTFFPSISFTSLWNKLCIVVQGCIHSWDKRLFGSKFEDEPEEIIVKFSPDEMREIQEYIRNTLDWPMRGPRQIKRDEELRQRGIDKKAHTYVVQLLKKDSIPTQLSCNEVEFARVLCLYEDAGSDWHTFNLMYGPFV